MKSLFSSLLVLILLVFGCKPKNTDLTIIPPTASFSIGNNNCQASCVVTFQNTSTGDGIESYSWDFGDGTTGNTRDAVHTYNVGGNYTVTLTVQTNEGKSNATQQLVTVSNATPLPPSKCRIKIISINQFPIYAGNTLSNWNWDQVNGGNDIYADCKFTLTDDLGVSYASSNVLYDVMEIKLPFLWQIATNPLNITEEKPITNFSQNYRLRFWDYDPADPPDEIIKDFNFKPSDHFPSNNQVGETQFTIYATGFGPSGSSSRVLNGLVILEWYN